VVVNRENDDASSDEERQPTDAAVESEDLTAAAPSFRSPGPPPDARGAPTVPLAAPIVRAARDDRPLSLLPGARVDDFEIVRVLGRGAFGIVYLARQLSLDRHVALKISANRGSEGRTMARLEHQHIVQVFSETVEKDFNQRLLCMQLIPGVSLDKLINAIHAKYAGRRTDGPPAWTGQDVLATIDAAASLPAAFDPSALHDREALAKMDAVEATAWFGARLAEALDFAHKHGVLHRDIKPANVLVNPYGRPMLADFNISSQPIGSEPSGDEIFGGTFAYMAPEHLDAFNPAVPVGPEVVDQRSDLYSLGLVLDQMLEDRLGFILPEPGLSLAETLRRMSDERRGERPPCRTTAPGARQTLERTIDQALAPLPADRFASGAEFAEQLDGCRRLREAEKHLPRVRGFFEPILRRPLLWLILLVVLQQNVASIVNTTYNVAQIGARELNSQQRTLFSRIALGYNAIVYPVAIVFFGLALQPIGRCWLTLARGERVSDQQVTGARRQALRLPRWIAVLTILGWFPGGVLFPVAIHWFAGPIDIEVAAHFLASFWLSGLIALAYSLCAAEFVLLRVLYPAMWTDVRRFSDTARRELVPVDWQLAITQWLAVSIPLLAAVLVVILGRDADMTFRLLVAGLIVLGVIGFQFASHVTRGLSQVVTVLTGRES
jgi:serine/threonine protein kinase